MKIYSIIPARYQSSRFPGKPLAEIYNKPMIEWVYNNAKSMSVFDEVYVATDNELIFDCVKSFGGNALMTSDTHKSGSDRLAECAELLKIDDNDIIVNLQGDEPLVKPQMLSELIDLFADQNVYMATLKKKILDQDEIKNPNVVKVIADIYDNALMFSRNSIPYNRDKCPAVEYFKHIGLYAYRKWFLMKYTEMSQTPLEKAESLEQLRVLENGFKIKIAETAFQSIGVDTPEQLQEVESIIKENLINM